MSQTLFALSGLMIVITTIVYLREMFKGNSRPNPVTWLICLVTMSLNAATYYLVSGRDLLAIITPVTITLGMLVVVVYSFISGRVGQLNWFDWTCLGSAIVIGTLWQITKNATIANLLMQVVLFVSFWPTIVGVLSGRGQEKALPWVLGMSSYFFLLPAVVVKEHWEWIQLAYPFVNGIIGNGLVVVAIVAKNRRLKASLV